MNYKNKNDILCGSEKQLSFHLSKEKREWNKKSRKLNNVKSIKAFKECVE